MQEGSARLPRQRRQRPTHQTLKKPARVDPCSQTSNHEGARNMRGQSIVRNRLQAEDRAFHDWYRFVLAFPPHLVRQYLERFDADPERDVVLDPFCGTGTVLVEAKKLGYATVGVEGNPMAYLASRVKSDWGVGTDELQRHLARVLRKARRTLDSLGVPEHSDLPLFSGGAVPNDLTEFRDGLSPEQWKLIPQGFISPLPLAKALALREAIDAIPTGRARDALRLAFAATLVEKAGNVGFGPEVYRTKAKTDAPVLEYFEKKARAMIEDLSQAQKTADAFRETTVYLGDSREIAAVAPDLRADIVITSPPYPNEKDYTRTTRLESVILGLLETKKDLRATKELLLRSNTRNVFKGDDDDEVTRRFPSIIAVSEEVERKRVELGKTSGFERLYHKVVTLYFGGMHRHLESLWNVLSPGARCAYVVGDQMSYFLTHIKTGELLAEIAADVGYEVIDIDLWRTRFSTASKIDLREEVVLLRKP